MKVVGVIAAVILGIAALVGLGWFFAANDLAMQKYFSPRQEQVRREVFEQSKAYNQGMIQELQNMQFEYAQADKEHKAALRSIILHRTADYDLDRLPPDLREFIETLKNPSEITR